MYPETDTPRNEFGTVMPVPLQLLATQFFVAARPKFLAVATVPAWAHAEAGPPWPGGQILNLYVTIEY